MKYFYATIVDKTDYSTYSWCIEAGNDRTIDDVRYALFNNPMAYDERFYDAIIDEITFPVFMCFVHYAHTLSFTV